MRSANAGVCAAAYGQRCRRPTGRTSRGARLARDRIGQRGEGRDRTCRASASASAAAAPAASPSRRRAVASPSQASRTSCSALISANRAAARWSSWPRQAVASASARVWSRGARRQARSSQRRASARVARGSRSLSRARMPRSASRRCRQPVAVRRLRVQRPAACGSACCGSVGRRQGGQIAARLLQPLRQRPFQPDAGAARSRARRPGRAPDSGPASSGHRHARVRPRHGTSAARPAGPSAPRGRRHASRPSRTWRRHGRGRRPSRTAPGAPGGPSAPPRPRQHHFRQQDLGLHHADVGGAL